MRIGIVGFGNLGRALASGLTKSGCAAGGIFVCDNSPDARALAEKDYRISASEDINFVFGSADVIFLTVKGYVFEELSAAIKRQGLVGKTVVSFMAGVPFGKIYSLIGDVALVRAMPSLAIAECDGVIGYTKAPAAVAELFSKLGYAFETEAENIEKVMAFSSCGLGFAAYLIDAFAAAGQTMGFSPETSARIASLTFKNAVARGGFKETVKAVATPGGATEQGIKHMDESSVYDTVAGAVVKAYERMANLL
ncbi:MAG: NAD(P)-binding domain-containing protein [Oscillospiraceae bacterium]|nr:NAD(P)-binding domain-containing protein [Oscillospiraceae bacterium]